MKSRGVPLWSRPQLAAVLRVHAGSVSRLEAYEALPVAVRGAPGKAAQYDPGAVFSWALNRERRKHSAPTALRADQERARKDRSAAELNELKLQRQRGEVVAARDVELLWSRRVVQTRTTLLDVPARLKGAAPTSCAPTSRLWTH